MFDEGAGVKEDNVEAVAWYTRAAEHGDADAQNNLGAMFDAGEGIPENDTEAVKWYLLAAEQGNSIAQNNLGAMYFSGEGIEENQIEAYKWFYISGELGNDDGRDNSQLASESMVSGEVLKAKTLGREWLEEFENSATVD
jgi:hypothetical protein